MVTDPANGRLDRELKAGSITGTFEAAMSEGGAQLPVMRAIDRVQHAFKGGAAESHPILGSIWRGLIVAHWRVSLEVTSETASLVTLGPSPLHHQRKACTTHAM